MEDPRREPFEWPEPTRLSHEYVYACPMCAALVTGGDRTKHEHWHEANGIDGLQRAVMHALRTTFMQSGRSTVG